MTSMVPAGEVMRVVVAGGGIAALEVIAGFHALAGDRVRATLLSPVASFSYRPLSTAVPFTFREERTRRLDELAGGLGAAFVHDALAHVDVGRDRILTHNGDLLPYDALVVAVGSRAEPAAAGERWTRGADGTRLLTRILRELEDGTTRSVAFVVPRHAAWPVDAYELALVASLAARRADSTPKVLLLTAEANPLEALGEAASEAVHDELTRAGVELIAGVEVHDPTPTGEVGQDALSSVHDQRGFIPVDGHCGTPDTSGVYAAGDATSLTLKHSSVAASQGASAAEAIAAEAGADVEPGPWSPVLYGILTLPPHFAGAPGSPWLDSGEPLAHCLWWPPGHAAGRHLGPYLASRDPGVRPGLEWHPGGLPVAVPVGADPHGEAGTAPSVPAEASARHDAMTRQLMAIRRAEREGERLEHALDRRGEEFERHEREVIQRLRAAGYLRDEAAGGQRRPRS